MTRIFTLEEAEQWFKIKEKQSEQLDKLILIKDKSQWQLKLEEKLRYLLSYNVLPIDRIVYTIKYLNVKGIVINYTIIKQETDVIIHYEDKPTIGDSLCLNL